MEATLILADAATGHPDGTFSLLRGGITELHIKPNTPPVFRGALVARILVEPSEAGKHSFKIVCTNDDGHLIGREFEGEFGVAKGGGAVNLTLTMQVPFPCVGRYTFAIAVDSRQLDSWTIEAKEAKQKKGK